MNRAEPLGDGFGQELDKGDGERATYLEGYREGEYWCAERGLYPLLVMTANKMSIVRSGARRRKAAVRTWKEPRPQKYKYS